MASIIDYVLKKQAIASHYALSRMLIVDFLDSRIIIVDLRDEQCLVSVHLLVELCARLGLNFFDQAKILLVYKIINFIGGLAFVVAIKWLQIRYVTSVNEYFPTLVEWVIVYLLFSVLGVLLATFTLLLFYIFGRLNCEINFLDFGEFTTVARLVFCRQPHLG